MIPATIIFAGIVALGASIFRIGDTGPRLGSFMAGMFGVGLIAVGACVLVGGV